MPQNLNIVHLWDGWLPSYYYGQAFQRDDKLQIGGWGDTYETWAKFDIEGLPVNPTQAIFWVKSYPRGDGSTTTPLAFCKVGGFWDLSLTWSNQPSMLTCAGWFSAPTPGNWWGINFTSWYNEWKNNQVTNNGIMMFPQYTNNNFDVFRSSRYSYDGDRPILQFSFTPSIQLKMPLPGNHRWLMTTETGGYDCLAKYPAYWPDTAHTGSNYFSLDFSWRNIPDSGATVYTETSNIPVIAAAAGTVTTFYNDPSNGNYVVVTHGSTGFTTRYLHLDTILVSNGASVTQGSILGYMGATGQAVGKHLHFGVRYNNSGSSGVAELSKVVMDGWILKSFQTECSVNGSGVPTDWIRYYRSGNTVY